LVLLRIGWISAVVGEARHRCISTEHQRRVIAIFLLRLASYIIDLRGKHILITSNEA